MANYTFLPYLRRGIIGLVNDNAEKDRLNILLQLQAKGEGEAPIPINRSAQVFGPGDITGLNYQAIVRTIPRAGVNDYEANFLAAIEFYDEDFVWRYAPLLPDAEKKLQPWLWLIVLEENEYQRLQSDKANLPVIDIMTSALQSAFPDPETTVAWAHTHLNFKPDGNTAATIAASIQQKLDENPNLGCSRLICPRRLRPNARYNGFLIPAFEKGRLAGLGRPTAEIANVPNAQPSWSISNENNRINPNQFPVYFEWGFATASEGDFEDLARKLSPLSIEEQKDLAEATKLLDVRNPGWGIIGAKGAIRLESALKLPNLLPDTTDEINDKTILREKIAPLLNLSVTPLNSTTGKNTAHPYFKAENDISKPSNLADDPIITPPLYGSFYRPSETLNTDVSQNWYSELNLSPVYRIAAAQGTDIIQKNQEDLMDRAWEQWGTYAEMLKVKRRWVISEQLSQTMSEKRLKPLLNISNSLVQYRATSFFSPLIPTIKTEGGTNEKLGRLVTSEAERPSTFSATFLKITRTGGPLMRRLTDRSKGILFLELTRPIPAQIPTPPIQRAVNTIINWLNENQGSSEKLKNIGLAGVEPLKTAVSQWLPYVSLKSIPPIRRTDVHKKVLEGIWVQIAPQNTILARFETMVRHTTPSGQQNTPIQTAPVFVEPMYKPLADNNTEFILPGLDKIPANRVAILLANSAFIESYMVGLNHEMAREFLWREFPAPLNATYFRQFWDVRNSNNPKPDIQPILEWQANTKMGTHAKPPGQPVSEDSLVVVIRGDLLRKYPNTEIFMVKANWENQQAGSHKLALDVNNQAQWINDSPSLRRPLFSARIEPDFSFLGFNLGLNDVKGNNQNPGWFFVLKERAGDVHFGLDLKLEPNSNDPSWEQLAEIRENQCIQVKSAQFAALPRSGKRADQVAAMLYQKPFMLFVHASRLLP